MKKVLIAIDYNPGAQNVADAGYAYAKRINAKISIVHSITETSYDSMEYRPIMGFTGFSADGLFSNIEERKNEASNFLKAVLQYLGDKDIKTQVLEGKAAYAILEYAVEWKADLIVMGSQNHNGFEKLLMGNVVSSVLKDSAIPVLIVPTYKQVMNMIGEIQNMIV